MAEALELASAIEHTLLCAEAVPGEIDSLCEQAARYGFAGVCVNPVYVRRVAESLARLPTGSRRPAVVTVVGFPLGANLTETKSDDARRAIDEGAEEIDMVVHLGALRSGDARAVRDDIEAVARVVHGRSEPGVLKVILETAALGRQEKILGCRCAAEGEADFVKTSTGFHPAGGATVEDVALLYRHAAPLRVKAAGGIRTLATAAEMIKAGAARIGTSSGVTIMRELDDTDR